MSPRGMTMKTFYNKSHIHEVVKFLIKMLSQYFLHAHIKCNGGLSLMVTLQCESQVPIISAIK